MGCFVVLTSKYFSITMIVLDGNSMSLGMGFKSKFSSFASKVGVMADVAQARCLVYKENAA